jgi:hypothetical protein
MCLLFAWEVEGEVEVEVEDWSVWRIWSVWVWRRGDGGGEVDDGGDVGGS